MRSFNEFTPVQRKLRRDGNKVARKINMLKLRYLSNQCDAMWGMTSALSIVVRIGVNVGVNNRRSADDVRVGK